MILINDFSKQTKISIRMLRYLEEMELLKPSRAENNYRYYTQDQIIKANMIKELQELGLQLKEIRELFDHPKKQIPILTGVLSREIEVAEIKSETIPKLKFLLQRMEKNDERLIDLLQSSKKINLEYSSEGKFPRTVSIIPALKNILEEEFTVRAEVTLIESDLMKFSQFLKECNLNINAYSILDGTTFLFGHNLSSKALSVFSTSWEKHLPKLDICRMEDFASEDLKELMGSHDVIIRTRFRYSDNSTGEVTLPYGPIFALVQGVAMSR